MQLLAICATFTFHLDSNSADYLGMESSVLGDAPDTIECGSIISTVSSVYVKLVLCSMQWFPIDCQAKLRSQAIVEVCGVAQAEGGKPQTIQQKDSTNGQNNTATAAQRLYSQALSHNIGSYSSAIAK